MILAAGPSWRSIGVLLGAAALAGGCGGGTSRRTASTGTPPLQVTSSSCTATAGAPTPTTCVYVVSDGSRFRCSAHGGSTATVAGLRRDRSCTALSGLVIAPRSRAVFAAVGAARACLTGRGLGVTGGPVLPPDPRRPDGPDGELIVGTSTGGAFVSFYRDRRRARRLEPAVIRNARRFGGQTQRHGAVTVVWIHPPPSRALRQSLQACVTG